MPRKEGNNPCLCVQTHLKGTIEHICKHCGMIESLYIKTGVATLDSWHSQSDKWQKNN